LYNKIINKTVHCHIEINIKNKGQEPIGWGTSPRLSNGKADSEWQICNEFESRLDYKEEA
jgi:hypothetical protein